MEIQCFQVVWESQVLTPVSGSSSNTWNVIHQSTKMYIVVAVQLLNHVQLSATPWPAAHQASLSFIISWSLLKFMSTESVMLSNHLILCHPFSFFLLFLPASESFPLSRLFTSGGQSIGVSASVLSVNIQS